MKKLLGILLTSIIMVACTVSYSFKGISIDYTKVKTMEIRDFVNQAPLNYPPLIIRFNEHLKDVYTRNTKLSFVDAGGDIELEGEIVRYDLTPMSLKEMDTGGGQVRASETRLTMSVKIRYRNNVQPGKDKEETITAYRDFNNEKMLDDVQDELIEELNKDIIDQIFNATLSDW